MRTKDEISRLMVIKKIALDFVKKFYNYPILLFFELYLIDNEVRLSVISSQGNNLNISYHHEFSPIAIDEDLIGIYDVNLAPPTITNIKMYNKKERMFYKLGDKIAILSNIRSPYTKVGSYPYTIDNTEDNINYILNGNNRNDN